MSVWIKTETILNNVSQYCDQDITIGPEYSLVSNIKRTSGTLHPILQNYKVLEYKNKEHSIYVLVELKSEQERSLLETQFRVEGMHSLPDIGYSRKEWSPYGPLGNIVNYIITIRVPGSPDYTFSQQVKI